MSCKDHTNGQTCDALAFPLNGRELDKAECALNGNDNENSSALFSAIARVIRRHVWMPKEKFIAGQIQGELAYFGWLSSQHETKGKVARKFLLFLSREKRKRTMKNEWKIRELTIEEKSSTQSDASKNKSSSTNNRNRNIIRNLKKRQMISMNMCAKRVLCVWQNFVFFFLPHHIIIKLTSNVVVVFLALALAFGSPWNFLRTHKYICLRSRTHHTPNRLNFNKQE